MHHRHTGILFAVSLHVLLCIHYVAVVVRLLTNCFSMLSNSIL